jgi:hypothetical protein
VTGTGIHAIKPVDYYADRIADEPSLNATVAKLLISDSPLHAWTAHPKLNPGYRETVDKKFDVGTAAHEVFLLGNDHLIHVVEANDWRTKAAQEVRDRAREEGMLPLLAGQWQDVSAMLTALRSQLPGIDAAPALFTAGKPEQTLVWRDRDVLCRARLDWIHDSLECVDDLKTAARTANPHVWTRTTMWGIGADIQAAFTLRGLKAAVGVDSTFRFVIAETHEPYAIAAVSPSEQTLALSNAKIDVALERWKRCLAENAWPAYPPHVLTVDPPAWAETQWWESQQLEEEMAA